MKRNLPRALFILLLFFGLSLTAPEIAAAQGIPLATVRPQPGGASAYSLNVQTLLLLTALTFLPAALLMMTSFTRIIIVLSLLRMALGTQTSPPNQVLIGIALFLTFFIMAPVFDRIYQEAWLPYERSEMAFEHAVQRAALPIKEFMLAQVREGELRLFADLADLPAVQKPEELPLRVVVPAFITSELKTAFQIGFMIFLPFLIIDMIVASVLMAMGMMMMSPVLVALPFKLLVFVLVDGWTLLVGSLVRSFSL
ncbi:MAG: flagellar type III secretion system pore protein FliP [Hydrogenophilus sp.]|nr:flagellar type III secretion system pore protein FliP [Hydrogenophilus sp.]